MIGVLFVAVLLASLAPIYSADSVGGVAANAGSSLFEKQMLSVLPAVDGSGGEDFEVSTTNEFSPSEGPWATPGPEESVFLRAFRTVDLQGRSIEFRIGKGGHLYSIQSAIGELVPPQWRDARHNMLSPWNDEVWQSVAVTREPDKIFVHQSGCYVKTGEAPIYAPCLAQSWSPEQKTFTMLSWGMVPQTSSPLVSEVLYYSRYRFAARGVLEVTVGIFDFGKNSYPWLNAPWGGVRQTALGELWMADANERGAARRLDPLPNFGDRGTDFAPNTGGWMAFAQESGAVDRYALGLTFGRDDFPTSGIDPALLPRAKTLLRFGRAGGKSEKVARATRNYLVAVVIPRLGVTPGRGIWWRYYMVFGAFDSLKKQCPEWAEKTSGGEMFFPAAASETRALEDCLAANAIPADAVLDSDLSRSARLDPWPKSGSKPVFAFQLKKDSSWVVTSDVAKYAALGQKDDNGRELYSVGLSFSEIRLLGFAPGRQEEMAGVKTSR